MAYKNRADDATWSRDEREKPQQRRELLNTHLNIQTVCTTDGITWGSLQVTECPCLR